MKILKKETVKNLSLLLNSVKKETEKRFTDVQTIRELLGQFFELIDVYPEITIENSASAFEQAIKEGRLSDDKNAKNSAYKYMYMYHKNGVAQFKNMETRTYL